MRFRCAGVPNVARVDYSVRVRIHTVPSRQSIESVDRPLVRGEQCPSNAVALEQWGEGAVIAVLGLEIASEERVAVQLDAAIDEGLYSAENQIPAKALAVEDRTVEPHPRGGRERRCWGYGIVCALDRAQQPREDNHNGDGQGQCHCRRTRRRRKPGDALTERRTRRSADSGGNLPTERGSYNERPDEPEKIGVPHMRQRHVTQHSHVRLCQMQANELVACEQALVLGSSGQGRRRGR